MNRQCLAGAVVVTSLALSAAPAFAGTQAKPKVVVFKAGVKSLPKSVGVGKSVTIDPRATTVPKGDGVTSFTIIFGDGATTKHKGGLTPLKHTYKKAGTYKVTLVVGDKHKKTVRTTVKLVVTAPKTVVATPTPTATTAPAPAPTTAPAPVKPPAPVVTPDPTGPLEGIVQHNGAGVAGLLVVAVLNSTAENPPEYRTNSTSDGAYALPALAGTYTVYVDVDPDQNAPAPNPAYSAEAFTATVTAGKTTTLPISIDAAVTVKGIIQDTRGNAAPSTVDLTQVIANAVIEVDVATTSTGAYVISGASDTNNALFDGTVPAQLSFTPNSLYLQDGGSRVDLTKSGGTTAVQPTAQLADASVVSGTVVLPDGSNAGSVNVVVRDSSGDQYGEAITASDGSFTIGNVPAGNYLVVADYLFAYVGGYNDAYAYNTPISVTTTTPATKPVLAGTAMLRTPGTIAGKVTDAKGVVANAIVTLITGDQVSFSATTDGNGNYTLPGLPPSTTAYTITASTTDSNGDVGEQGTTTATVTASMTTTAPTITIS